MTLLLRVAHVVSRGETRAEMKAEAEKIEAVKCKLRRILLV